MLKRRISYLLARMIHPRLAVIVHDLVMIWAGWLISRALSVSGTQGLETPLKAFLLPEIPLILLIQGGVFWLTGLYRGLWRFASLPDLWNLFKGAVLGTVLVLLALWLTGSSLLMNHPQLMVLYPVALVIFLGAPRLLFRSWKDATRAERQAHARTRTVILGAGHTGVALLRELQRSGAYQVLGFLDDDKALRGARIHGVRLLGNIQALPRLSEEMAVQLAIIALPAASNEQMQRVVRICEQAGVEFKTLPSLSDLGKPVTPSRLDDLKNVALEDLLGRQAVALDWQSLHTSFAGRQVLITGGGGSIGSELARLVAELEPAGMTILEQSEYNLYRIEMELRNSYPELPIHYQLGDVTDVATIEYLLTTRLPDVILHAAAYKHLPMLQGQVREAFVNNVLGTRRLAQAALTHQVASFVLISTDKAVNPSNVMGASKRIAELYCESLNGQGETRFLTVRFGNVLNSTGSVVPLFKEQIKRGGPVTVTHPDISRYFMTLHEASALILQAATLGQGGEIYVLDMGEPVSIRFLAEQLIRLHGQQPERDIKITYTGLRPGEKLHEELFHAQETLQPTRHPKILLARAQAIDSAHLYRLLDQAEQASNDYALPQLEQLLHSIIADIDFANGGGKSSH